MTTAGSKNIMQRDHVTVSTIYPNLKRAQIKPNIESSIEVTNHIQFHSE